MSEQPQPDKTSSTALPSHPHPGADTASQQSPSDDLANSLMFPAAPASHSDRARAGLERSRSDGSEWKPVYTRRQSWDAQERRHEEQMGPIQEVTTGPGFTEREGRASGH